MTEVVVNRNRLDFIKSELRLAICFYFVWWCCSPNKGNQVEVEEGVGRTLLIWWGKGLEERVHEPEPSLFFDRWGRAGQWNQFSSSPLSVTSKLISTSFSRRFCDYGIRCPNFTKNCGGGVRRGSCGGVKMMSQKRMERKRRRDEPTFRILFLFDWEVNKNGGLEEEVCLLAQIGLINQEMFLLIYFLPFISPSRTTLSWGQGKKLFRKLPKWIDGCFALREKVTRSSILDWMKSGGSQKGTLLILLDKMMSGMEV